MLSTKFRVNWPVVSGIEEKHMFPNWRRALTSDLNDFSYF